MLHRRTVIVLCLSLVACGGDDAATDAVVPIDSADTFVPPDVVGETVDFDTGSNAETTTEVVDPGGDFGAACQGNLDCESGWCVESVAGYVCTVECLEACPNGYDCKSVQNSKGDVTFLCLPRMQKLCVPCLQDFQCNGGACLSIGGSMQCASACDAEDDCPDGYTCAADATGTKSGQFCQPRSGACDCSPPFAGVARTCTRQNAVGTCLGVETCDPNVGWVGCTAREAVSETCDYIDNNCDGGVDEGFQEEGLYASETSCGSCTTSCDVVLANADETECLVQEGLARCQVVSCDPGYTQVNAFTCAPDVGNVCQPCQSNPECLGNGAACTELADGKFCTRACADDDDCSEGNSCKDTDNGKQCVPTFGSCTCDGSNTDLARSCSVTITPDDPNDPVVTCKGLEQCTATGWGGCALPEDSCDSIDNDCDGVIDGPFKTGDKYTALTACGACGISCLGFVRPNTTPVCDASSAAPVCSYRCTGDAIDVNGRSDDGCECIATPGPDLAGDDVDSNCDGVDGEVDNAIFVSKDGNDSAPGTREAPVKTLAAGIAKAKAGNKRDVYVATGVYSNNLVLEDGVGIFGGYSPEFDQHDVLLYETAIIGQSPNGAQRGTVTAVNVGAAGAGRDTVLDGFTIFGISAGNTQGGNSYGVYVRDSGVKLRISHNAVIGGPGGNGQSGTRGTDGPNGVDGAGGLAAKNLSGNCVSGNESVGGNGGARTCGAVDVGGGNGGRGRCPDFEVSPGTTANGSNGRGTGAGTAGSFGWPLLICATNDGFFGDPGCGSNGYYGCGTCYLPRDNKTTNASSGTNGATGSNGAKGAAGAATGNVGSGEWVGAKGGNGTSGANGAGGGGGGAGGSVEVDGSDCGSIGNDDVGGAGGGGGSGGCLGTGGTGGLAGGGSFALFIIGADASHTPTLVDNDLIGGTGGAGGNGGAGGVGGSSGKGGSGGLAGDRLSTATLRAETRCAAAGGDGGNGGSGGHGGGGGGGSGGPSYALFVSLPSAPPAEWKTNNAFMAGTGGLGGIGGVSIDQSRSGANGATGAAAATSF